MEENERKGLTVGEVFKIILKRKWLVLAITAAVLLVGVLFMELLYNPTKTTYTTYYNIEWPDKGSSYPDSTPFRYQDAISLETLEEIKKSDKKFEKVDVERMYANDDIGIDYLVTERENGKNVGGEAALYDYRLTVKTKYFSSVKVANDDGTTVNYSANEVATAFIRAVASYAANYAKESIKKVDFAVNLATYDSATTYEEKLALLLSEYNFIATKYENYVSSYENIIINGKTLKAYEDEAKVAFSQITRENLSKELSLNGYIPQDKLAADNALLLKQKAENEAQIEALTKLHNELFQGASSTDTALGSQIAGYVSRNVEIERVLASRNGADFAQKCAEFETKLDGYKDALAEQATICKTVSEALFEEQAITTFVGNRITKDGDTSLVITVILFIIIGLIVGGAVVCIMDLPAYLKAKKQLEEGGAEEAPAEGETPEKAEEALTETVAEKEESVPEEPAKTENKKN